ncbi:hypothetical protein AY633_12190 [Planococcus maritimus]|nr:hypothetical protein AY633_12190 [Planococcus maritimus]
MSRFVATLLQGLNCLANPPGVGPFHSVSSFKVGKSFFSLLEMKFGNASCFVTQITFTKERLIGSAFNLNTSVPDITF